MCHEPFMRRCVRSTRSPEKRTSRCFPLEETDSTGPFQSYLANWHRNTPERQRPLVAKIIELFGFPVPGQMTLRNAAVGVPQSR